MSSDSIRLKALLVAAIDFSNVDERAAFLKRECGDDVQLRERLDILLHACDAPLPHKETIATAAYLPLTDTLKQRVSIVPGVEQAFTLTNSDSLMSGKYRLVERIGQGGMGEVWTAEQTEPVKRRVAVKLILGGRNSENVIRRFEAERQALALMDHPGIARIYDGGITDQGMPFFVMELVQGVPLTTYCDDKRLTIRQRLELFVSICLAVQHAHQKGIIHRDLKPGNILVTEVDGKPLPKIIDFGVAKAVEQQLTDESYGDTGAIVGTPTYMSPEQADPSSMDIDTRTDLYALGVILFELLVGAPPLDARQFKKGALFEMLRMVREVDPPRLSTKLASSDNIPAIAARRSTQPHPLVRELQGDLDWITQKALEKDRTRRYDTAHSFVMDLSRYLNGEAVLAHPPNRWYRLKKFVKRHRIPLLLGSTMLLAFLGALFGVIKANNEQIATQLRQEAESARDGEKAARNSAEQARDGERVARREVEKEREKLAVFEYGKTIQIAYQSWLENNVPAARALLEGARKDLRGWEWKFVNRICNTEQFTLQGHAGQLASVVYSADGSRILTASGDKTAKIWDAKTGKLLVSLNGHTSVLVSAAFSKNGKRIVTGSMQNAKVWDAETGAELLTVQVERQLMNDAAINHDGSRIVTSGDIYTGNGKAQVWDTATGKELLTLRAPLSPFYKVAFSHNGERILTACGDKTAKVWDATNGKLLLTLKGHTSNVGCASYNYDSSKIVTASGDKTAKVWDANTGKESITLGGHTQAVACVAFSRDGKQIVSASSDKTAKVWNATTGVEVATLRGHNDNVVSAAFNADGTCVATASTDATAKVWVIQNNLERLTLKGHTTGVNSARFNADGTKIVTASWDGTTRIWDAASGKSITTLKATPAQSSIVRSPVMMATWNGSSTRVATAHGDGVARIWDADSGRELLALKGHVGTVYSVNFTPDNSMIVTGGHDTTIRVWDSTTGKEVLKIAGHQGSVASACFNNDGTRIVSSSYDRTAKVWDAQTGKELLTLKGHSYTVASAAFNREGTLIVTASHDSTAKLWNARTGQEILTLRGHTSAVRKASFNSDGTRIVTASADRSAKVWDVQTGSELLSLNGIYIDVFCADFSNDRTRLVTAGGNATVDIWDANRPSK